MKTIAIANQKGGIGKTTLCRNAGACLQAKGHRVLYIDLDPQQNLTYALQGPLQPQSGPSVIDLLEGTATIKDSVKELETGFLIPSDLQLSSNRPIQNQALKRALEAVRDDFDYCLIDTPPALNKQTITALTACDYVLIPAGMDIYSLQGTAQLFQTLKAVKSRSNPDLHVLGLVFTRTRKTAIARELQEMMKDTAEITGVTPFETTIRETAYIDSANAYQLPICTYRPKSGGAKDYEALTNEIEERIKDKRP